MVKRVNIADIVYSGPVREVAELPLKLRFAFADYQFLPTYVTDHRTHSGVQIDWAQVVLPNFQRT